MITAQDIREKTFEKARIGGYDMAAVDDFLDELAESVGAAQEESTVLKSKMKVLVDKIKEYRAGEETLSNAILQAQKLAAKIENDARTRAAAMLAEAEEQVKARVGSIEDETRMYERRLEDAKAATAKYFDDVRALCEGQISQLDSISRAYIPQPEVDETAGAADVEDAVRSIEDSASIIQPEMNFSLDLGPAEEPEAEVSLESTQPFTV
jgi:cell division initiation protein